MPIVAARCARNKRGWRCGADQHTVNIGHPRMGQRAPGTRDTGRYDLAAYQRHNLRREALETLNALGDGLAAEIEDQLVHADRREGTNITGDVIGSTGERPTRSVRRWDAGVVQRRLVGDRKCREIAPL